MQESRRCGGRRGWKKKEFCEVWNGDHLLVPFECDTCIFRKLRNDPNPWSEADILLMATIRGAHLDTFWSRAPDTVNGNQLKIIQALKL